jgi:hypothetical protein
MKMNMFVVGLKSVTEAVIELELVPVAETTKRKNPLEIALSGDARAILSSFEDVRQHRSKIYVSRVWCSENNINLFQSIFIEIKPV